ncbi:MAG TPA: LuxR C-terminal-related transcriptional regulator [Solirubrobacteraceae bacterium]|nr:LuxR C-terminal-related transcriptional regulator [Solirubrobacteraceae bacterium]
MPGDLPGASALVGAWPLIGRERELEAIASARADSTCHGVVVIADAGVGKSHLARQAQAAAEREGAFASWVQGTRSAAALPLGAVAELVPERARSDDLVSLLMGCGEELAARAAGRPVVLGVDDAQLLDPVSAALVLHLATSSSAFVLATVRAGESCPDAIVSLWKDDAARRLDLMELSGQDVRTLVETVLGDPIEEAALDWVIDVSQGNALYVRELVRGAVEAGSLVRSPGFWHVDGQLTASRSLIELIEQRMVGLTDDYRRAVEMLALCEPLALNEIAALTSENTLLEAEAHGLIAAHGANVRLAHPLYGETVRAALPPLRARSLRLALAEVIEARSPFGPDDAVRAARLRLDAGVTLAPALALKAARAANRAGDPDFGAELAGLVGADADLTAGMLLAQSHAMRNRFEQAEAALAAVEPLAAGHPNARDYIRQRLWLYQWGLRRPDDIGPLLDRVESWSEDPAWRGFTSRILLTYAAMGDGSGNLPDPTAENSAVTDEVRRGHATMRRLSAFVAGRGDAAAADAFAARPAMPVRDASDLGALGVLSLIAVETGYRWAELEEYMGQVLGHAVRGRDHAAAGLSALALARLHFLRGRYRDAARWLAETEVHLVQQDPFNTTIPVRSLQVGVASFTGDFDGTTAALDRLHVWAENHEPLPQQRVAVRRAEGWALRIRNAAEAGRRLLEEAISQEEEMLGLAPQLAYDALRAGAPAASVLVRMAARSESRLVSAYASHGAAKAAHDGPALMEAAEEMAAIGALRYGVEAASDAAIAFLAAGRQDSGRRAAALARQLHVPDQGAELPPIDGLDAAAVDLTPRETQLIELARQGLSNAEIADRLVISIRTVETHLYRSMQKLGVNDRRDL